MIGNSTSSRSERRHEPSGEIVVAIDGPAGAGKSSVAKRLAESLGFDFLDTGAMYRCVTLFCQRNQIPLDDPQAVLESMESICIEMEGEQVIMNGLDVTVDIRDPSVTRDVKWVADNQKVRAILVEQQRRWAAGKRLVTEGRDQGTVAFPQAACKIYLTASSLERARRRQRQLNEQGKQESLESILNEQELRDQQDRTRPQGGLAKADGAIELLTDGMSEEQVIAKMVDIVESALGWDPTTQGGPCR